MTKIIAIMALLGALVAGCAAPTAAPPTTAPVPAAKETPTPTATQKKVERIKFQIASKSAAWLSFYVGREKGVFKDEGIDLELIIMKAPLVVPALMAGEIDFTGITNTVALAGWQGYPVKALMDFLSKSPFHFMGGKGIESMADLKGKKVAVYSIGGGAHWSTKEILKTAGVDPEKDVTYVAMPEGGDQLAALKAGSVSAIGVSTPIDVLAKEEGFKELAYMGDYVNMVLDGVGTIDRKIKENPDQVKRFLRATIKAVHYTRDHPAEAQDFMVREMGLTQKVAKASYEDLLRQYNWDGTITDKAIEISVRQGKDFGQLKGEIDTKKGIDLTLLREVQKELGLAK